MMKGGSAGGAAYSRCNAEMTAGARVNSPNAGRTKNTAGTRA